MHIYLNGFQRDVTRCRYGECTHVYMYIYIFLCTNCTHINHYEHPSVDAKISATVGTLIWIICHFELKRVLRIYLIG